MNKRAIKRKKHRKRSRRKSPEQLEQSTAVAAYHAAGRLAREGRFEEARHNYNKIAEQLDNPRLRSLVQNDLAVLAALEGDEKYARAGFIAAIENNDFKEPAKSNLAMLESRMSRKDISNSVLIPKVPKQSSQQCKVAVVSFLFNWPSTGGGNIHTVELAQFLIRAGYEVRHFFVEFKPWGIGRVREPLPFPSEKLEFEESEWTAQNIQTRFREAVEQFDPDHVIITDSWNFKPLLAEALKQYPYILRLQAQECLCPLNNLGLLIDSSGEVQQCQNNQLADPGKCYRCLEARASQSGGLHQVERALSGVGTEHYDRLLRRAFERAEAVFVVNQPTADVVSDFAANVCVSPAGMDPDRFPWPWIKEPEELRSQGLVQLIFAGLCQERLKGYHVLHEACAKLWHRHQDFELVCTADPPGRINPFTRSVGWLPQKVLPRHFRAADICVVPTIAQEALGRTAVEAMAAGRPVVASRLGGLPTTIEDGVTGLLCEGGNANDLAAKIEILLDDPQLRERMGQSGRKRFEERFNWDVIIERDYRPLLKPRVVSVAKTGNRPTVAFGPVMPNWGSWEWIGEETSCELSKYYHTINYNLGQSPQCDILFVIKHIQSEDWLEQMAKRCAIIYCPVDFYGGEAEIKADQRLLRKCSKILVHSKQLMSYFEPYAPVEYIDHHVRFIAPMREEYQRSGHILWVGILSNLPSLVDWVNRHSLPAKLQVLTSLADSKSIPRPVDLGFRSDRDVSIHRWSKKKHLGVTGVPLCGKALWHKAFR